MKNTIKKTSFFKHDLPAYYFAVKDVKTPVFAKLIMIMTAIYVISPLDFLPDTIPMLGIVDDIILFPFIGTIFSKIIPNNIWEKSIEKADKLWFNKKISRKNKLIIIFIIFILFLILIRNLIS